MLFIVSTRKLRLSIIICQSLSVIQLHKHLSTTLQQMSSVEETFCPYITTVSQMTGIPDLLPLVAHQTKSSSDPKRDLEYLWQCMSGPVDDMKPIDAQRVQVMQWIGYLYHKIQNYVLAQWFPNVLYDDTSPHHGLSPEDIDALRQEAETLRGLCTEEQLVQVPPPPKLVRSVGHTTDDTNPRKLLPHEAPAEHLPPLQLWRNGKRPRRSVRLAQLAEGRKRKRTKRTDDDYVMTTDDVVRGC